MNKEEVKQRYLELVKELGEVPHEVVLSAGAALVMMGVREETADLDVDIMPNSFKAIGRVKGIKTDGGFTLIHYSDHVDLHEFDISTGRVCVDDVWTYSPGEMLTQKRYLVNHPQRSEEKRKQDRLDIEKLETIVKSPAKFTARAV